MSDEQRVSTSPIRDEATGLETLCAFLHASGSADSNVIKDVAWRTFNLIRAWREQGAEVERLRAELDARTDERDDAMNGWKKAEAERDRLAEQVQRTEQAVHGFFADADQRGVHLDGMTVTELCDAVMAAIRKGAGR